VCIRCPPRVAQVAEQEGCHVGTALAPFWCHGTRRMRGAQGAASQARTALRLLRGARASGRRPTMTLVPFPSSGRDLRAVRRVVAVLSLLFSAYCLIAAVTALYADTPADYPNPAELAARQRYQWPGS